MKSWGKKKLHLLKTVGNRAGFAGMSNIEAGQKNLFCKTNKIENYFYLTLAARLQQQSVEETLGDHCCRWVFQFKFVFSITEICH